MRGGDVFFDTNVLLYLISEDITKADRAETLLALGGVISVQVLNEFAAVALRKQAVNFKELRQILATIRAVRLDRQLLLSVAAVLAPDGQLFCFHECGAEPMDAVPGLRWGNSVELVRTLKSCVTIATKV